MTLPEYQPEPPTVIKTVPVGSGARKVWQTRELKDRDGRVVGKEKFAPWQLEASSGDEWRIVNAGIAVEGQTTHVSGRFRDDENVYRLRWVPAGGGGFVDDKPRAL